jgi:F-type H+-transporting ATPase subunit gamma
METIEELKRRIKSTEDLQSVVKTMKALAAVKIRQYERAVESLGEYNKTVETGLHMVLRNRPDVLAGARPGPGDRLGAIVFGSDQGMCGQLNDQISSYALEAIGSLQVGNGKRILLTVGQRVRTRIEDAGHPVEAYLPMPSSISGITPKVTELLTVIERWNTEQGVARVALFYSKQLSGARYRPEVKHLLPLDRQWLAAIREKPWPRKGLPFFTMDWDKLFTMLTRQYLFVSLFRAFAESLASENASRLASMQGAEKNIQEQLSELNMDYHQKRQMSITEELLDIVSGFEALRKEK